MDALVIRIDKTMTLREIFTGAKGNVVILPNTGSVESEQKGNQSEEDKGPEGGHRGGESIKTILVSIYLWPSKLGQPLKLKR